MRNAKKTLSLVMIAIFTTFIVLSGIPAGAVTAAAAKAQVTKATTAVVTVEKTVKVSTFNVTTAQNQLTAANKEVSKVKALGKTYAKTYTALAARTAAVNKKIAARKLVIAKQQAAIAKAYADANKAVEALEKAVDADSVDLVADAAALATAQGAVTSALEYIEKLDKNSTNYKGLMARVDMANTLISDAVAEVQEAEAAAEKEAADKAAKEAAAKLEAEAQAAADTAVKAVEDAVAAKDFVKATEAGKDALVKVDAVKDVEKKAAFQARLKVAYDKTQPAVLTGVTAIDGTITATFDKKPITTVAAADFFVTVALDGTAAKAVSPTAVTVADDTHVAITVPMIAQTTVLQTAVYSVQYRTTTSAVSVAPVIVVPTSLSSELAKVTNAVVSTIPYGTTNDKAGVEGAMVTLAQAAISTGFTVAIDTANSTYNATSKIWIGKFVVTHTATGKTLADAAYRTLTIGTTANPTGAQTELAKVTNAVVTTVPYGTANTQAAVEAAMLTLATAAIDSTNYVVTIAAGSTYSTVSKVWTGKFIVTNKTTAGNTATDAGYRAITVATGADVSGAIAELAKVTNAVITTVPFGTANTQAAVEAAILVLANAAVDSANYAVTMAAGSTYSTVTKLWTGKLIVTNKTTAANTITDAAYRNVTVATAADPTLIAAELAKITNAVVTTVPYGTANTQAGVEAAMITLATAAIDNVNYTVTIAAGSTYSTVTKVWTGKFTVTSKTSAINTVTDAGYRSFVVLNAADAVGATAELAKITNTVITTVPYNTLNTQAAVETAILALATAAIDSANYTVTMAAGSTYSTVSKLWTGKLIVTSKTAATNTATDAAYRNITVATGVDNSGAIAELAKVTDAVVMTVPHDTVNTQAAIEAAMLVLANAAIDNANYTVTIAAGSTYNTVTKAWNGKFVVTSKTDAANTKTDASYRLFVVTIQ